MNDFLFLCVLKIKYGICLYEWESKEDSLHFFFDRQGTLLSL